MALSDRCMGVGANIVLVDTILSLLSNKSLTFNVRRIKKAETPTLHAPLLAKEK